jgi:hypothetical protein
MGSLLAIDRGRVGTPLTVCRFRVAVTCAAAQTWAQTGEAGMAERADYLRAFDAAVEYFASGHWVAALLDLKENHH